MFQNVSKFKLIFRTIGESIYFDLQELKSLNNKKYQSIFSLTTLQKMNCWFNQFLSLDKLIKIFSKMMKSNKFKIKNEINKNSSNKFIYFVNALDEEDIIYIELKIKEQNQNDINENLIQMIKELKEQNIQLEKRIDLMEKNFGEKINLL